MEEYTKGRRVHQESASTGEKKKKHHFKMKTLNSFQSSIKLKPQPKYYMNIYSVVQLCPTFATQWTIAPPGSSVHGIFQARILVWVAISSSRRPSQSRDHTCISCFGRWILYLGKGGFFTWLGSPNQSTIYII